MNRYEALLAGIVITVVVIAMSFSGYQTHICRLEAIKAGMKGEEVIKACR